MSTKTRYAFALSVLLLFVTHAVVAIEQVSIQIGDWSTEQVDIHDLQLEFKLQSNGVALIATAKKIHLADPMGALSDVSLHCKTLRWLSGQIDCQAGQLSFFHEVVGNQNITFTVQSRAETENYQIALKGIQIAQGNLDLQANYQQGHWQAQLNGRQVALDSFITIISSYMSQKQLEPFLKWNVNAIADVEADLIGYQWQLNSAMLSGQFKNITFSDPNSRYVGEALAAKLKLDLNSDNSGWSWQQTLSIEDGQAYFEPIFLNAAEQPLIFYSEGTFDRDHPSWQIHEFHFEQGKSLQANGQLVVKAKHLSDLQLDITSDDLNHLNSTWIQPFMPGSSLSHIQAHGEVKAHLEWQTEQYQLQLQLQSVTVADQADRFAIDDLNGNLAWTNQAITLPIDLRWHSASIFSIPLGTTIVQAEANKNQIQLANLTVPILDGELSLNDFRLHLDEDKNVQWQFDGLLSPVSMALLTPILGWPTLQGKLSGMIPKVNYADEVMTVEGALMMKVFDGTTVIRDLRLQQPFGTLPQLYANIDINRLDLNTLTNTFDFGSISGKLDGHLHNLRLSNWEPVQFDASFYTPEEEPGRRRISQRAVNNLSQIGGGPAAILSRGFMGFFEDFSYKKMGLSCRLINSVCQMAGIETAEQGYYIVKGGGLPPWINVIGYNREVNWPELIARLKAVSKSDGPVIQ